ncbi:MAG: glycine cleavage system protein GcvH [Leptospirales bacterium]
MSKIPENLKYSKEHEWVEVQSETKVRVGITDYAQDSLGDIVFVETPDEGKTFAKDESFGSIESVKAVSDMFAPVGGKIIGKNETLVDSPESVNSDPYGKGWLIELEPNDASQLDSLMDAAAYKEYISTL